MAAIATAAVYVSMNKSVQPRHFQINRIVMSEQHHMLNVSFPKAVLKTVITLKPWIDDIPLNNETLCPLQGVWNVVSKTIVL